MGGRGGACWLILYFVASSTDCCVSQRERAQERGLGSGVRLRLARETKTPIVDKKVWYEDWFGARGAAKVRTEQPKGGTAAAAAVSTALLLLLLYQPQYLLFLLLYQQQYEVRVLLVNKAGRFT